MDTHDAFKPSSPWWGWTPSPVAKIVGKVQINSPVQAEHDNDNRHDSKVRGLFPHTDAATAAQ